MTANAVMKKESTLVMSKLIVPHIRFDRITMIYPRKETGTPNYASIWKNGFVKRSLNILNVSCRNKLQWSCLECSFCPCIFFRLLFSPLGCSGTAQISPFHPAVKF